MDTVGRVCPNIHPALFCDEGQEGIIDTEVDSISFSCTFPDTRTSVRLMNVGEIEIAHHMTFCEASSRLIGIRQSNRVAMGQGRDKVNEVKGALPSKSQ